MKLVLQARNTNADVLKSISIFGVVFIHGSSILGESDIMLFLRDMFRFTVPCFITLWSFFFEKSYQKKNKTDRRKYIVKRFVHLFRVFVLWSLLYFFLTVDWQNFTAKDILTKYFSGYGWSGQYFFIILFQFLLLYPLIRKVYEIKFLRVLTLATVVLIYLGWNYSYGVLPEPIKKLGFRPFLFWLPYVFLGMALAKNKVNRISLWFGVCPLLLAVEFLLLRKWEFSHMDYITLGVLVFSLLFCIALLQSKSIVVPERFNNVLGFVGRNTLIVFVSNPLIIILINKLLEVGVVNERINLFPLWTKVVLSLIAIILIFMGTLGIAKFLHKSTLIKIFG